MTTATFTANPTLDQFVQTLEARFPEIGERAQKAAELVEAGQVRYLGTDRYRRDPVWTVSGRYHCSIEGKACTCPDANPSYGGAPWHNDGPLCKHRIAAMMTKRLQDDKLAPLRDIFRQASVAGAEEVRLYVSVLMTYSRKVEQLNTVEGYLIAGDGRTRTMWDTAEKAQMMGTQAQVRLTFAELETVLAAAGWRYETKHSTKRSTDYAAETWYCVPQEAHLMDMTPALATHVDAVAA